MSLRRGHWWLGFRREPVQPAGVRGRLGPSGRPLWSWPPCSMQAPPYHPPRHQHSPPGMRGGQQMQVDGRVSGRVLLRSDGRVVGVRPQCLGLHRTSRVGTRASVLRGMPDLVVQLTIDTGEHAEWHPAVSHTTVTWALEDEALHELAMKSCRAELSRPRLHWCVLLSDGAPLPEQRTWADICSAALIPCRAAARRLKATTWVRKTRSLRAQCGSASTAQPHRPGSAGLP